MWGRVFPYNSRFIGRLGVKQHGVRVGMPNFLMGLNRYWAGPFAPPVR